MDTLPSTHYHTPLTERFNREARERGDVIDLNPQALIDEARRETGLERFGDESFLPAMNLLLDAVEREADLNPFGRSIARMRTVRSLKNRLWTQACLEAEPAIRERKLPAPVIIVGPHRSGTTRLQHMLATDPRLQFLTTWEGTNPAPRPGTPDRGRAARFEEVKVGLAAREHMYPGAYLAHPMMAEWPEEEMLLLNHSFCGFSPLGLYHVPSYYDWFLHGDKRYGYRSMADMLRLISADRQAPEGRPWLLKNPQHMLDLGILMETFPDARLIFTHRDPIKTVGSIMSLVWYYAVQHTDRPCRAQIRDVWLDFCEQMARRCMGARESIPAAQQIDIQYADMNRDWRTTMHRIYDFIGLEFTPEAERAQVDWLERSEREHRHGGHRYDLADFGTSPEEVDARMRFARERYGIPYERN